LEIFLGRLATASTVVFQEKQFPQCNTAREEGSGRIVNADAADIVDYGDGNWRWFYRLPEVWGMSKVQLNLLVLINDGSVVPLVTGQMSLAMHH
jgi:hypothetical protein